MQKRRGLGGSLLGLGLQRGRGLRLDLRRYERRVERGRATATWDLAVVGPPEVPDTTCLGLP